MSETRNTCPKFKRVVKQYNQELCISSNSRCFTKRLQSRPLNKFNIFLGKYIQTFPALTSTNHITIRFMKKYSVLHHYFIIYCEYNFKLQTYFKNFMSNFYRVTCKASVSYITIIAITTAYSVFG